MCHFTEVQYPLPLSQTVPLPAQVSLIRHERLTWMSGV